MELSVAATVAVLLLLSSSGTLIAPIIYKAMRTSYAYHCLTGALFMLYATSLNYHDQYDDCLYMYREKGVVGNCT